MKNVNFNVGDIIDGRYKLERLIGDGGSAVVFLADDTLIGREVAIKILNGDDESAVNTRSFVTEIQAVSVLSHPNIVNVYDVAVNEDVKYIVMEYVDGITLRQYMNQNQNFDTEEIISCAAQVLSALEEAHAKKIVHRDIKPQNIMLLRDGTIKVTDFGIAMLPTGDEMSMEGRAVGTVYYISPEQAKGKPVDERSDIYSLGVLMYEMATGKLPFDGKNPSDVAMKQITDIPRRPREINPDIPKGLEQIILMAMEKDPDARFQSATAMKKALEKLDENPDYIPKGAVVGTEKVKNRVLRLNVLIPILAGVLLAIAIIILIILLAGRNKPLPADDTQTIQIPTFVGRIYTADDHDMYLANYHINVNVNYYYSGEYPAGQVMNQTIEPGSLHVIDKDAVINIWLDVSLGQRPITLGKVEGNYKDVIAALRSMYANLNFKVVRVWEYDDKIPEDDVVRWESTTATDVIVGSIITLYISAGPESEKYTTEVPSLVGMNVADAIVAIESAGLHVGNIEYRMSSTTNENRVLLQSRTAGDKIFAKVNTIDIVVGGGPYYGQ